MMSVPGGNPHKQVLQVKSDDSIASIANEIILESISDGGFTADHQ
jgi:hypothetical protein